MLVELDLDKIFATILELKYFSEKVEKYLEQCMEKEIMDPITLDLSIELDEELKKKEITN